MSGLDKIVEQIHMEAEKEAEEILNSADKYCDAYMEQVKNEVSKEVGDYNKKALKERELYEEKTRSGIEFQERNALLKARQECIGDVIDKSMATIKEMSDDKYFELMEQILKANVHKGQCELMFGVEDLKRLPKDFETKAKEAASKVGGELMLSKEPANIKDGFMLEYGEIQENCTLRTLFDTNIDKLRDIVSKELFG